MLTVAARFTSFLADLRAAVAAQSGHAQAACDWARTALFSLLWNRLGRTARRFEALFAKWQSGTLPKPRKPRAVRPTTPRERPRVSPRLPRGRAWLLAQPEQFRLVAAATRSRLEHMFTDPSFEQFVREAPQAGRLLRPLCHMLGVDPPSPLCLPDRPAPARPSPPPRPKPLPLRPIYPIGFRPPLFEKPT